ncbi:MAG TPA: hypothetical protein DD417_17240 [Elusimicrobia bacterium]|nr:hypothetical protein [Elusimicrobiota bacterium]
MKIPFDFWGSHNTADHAGFQHEIACLSYGLVTRFAFRIRQLLPKGIHHFKPLADGDRPKHILLDGFLKPSTLGLDHNARHAAFC